MEYEHLARGLRDALVRDPHALDAERLAAVSSETLVSWFRPFTPPQVDERRRKVQELGEELQRSFNGQALDLITRAEGSAVEAVRLVLAHLPGFRDHAVYRGEQVHFYKRAQILVGDVWAAYGRRTTGIASFHDIAQLTMFGTSFQIKSRRSCGMGCSQLCPYAQRTTACPRCCVRKACWSTRRHSPVSWTRKQSFQAAARYASTLRILASLRQSGECLSTDA